MYDWTFANGSRYGQAKLVFSDYSVPEDDPIHAAQPDTEIPDAINRKIARSDAAVIPTGMYVNYGKWINKGNRWGQEEEQGHTTCESMGPTENVVGRSVHSRQDRWLEREERLESDLGTLPRIVVQAHRCEVVRVRGD